MTRVWRKNIQNSAYLYFLWISILFLAYQGLIYFRVHVLGEDIPCPPLPPYFSQSLFDTIKSASEAGFDVSHMTNKQWYSFLMQQDFSENVNGKWEPKLCKIETRNPDANWERIWRNG